MPAFPAIGMSGAAWATNSSPLAPARFFTIKGSPSYSCNLAAVVRAIASVAPATAMR